MEDKVEFTTLRATEEGSLSLDIPEIEKNNRTLSPSEVLMSAFFFRASNDSEWVQELFDWFSERYGEELKESKDD